MGLAVFRRYRRRPWSIGTGQDLFRVSMIWDHRAIDMDYPDRKYHVGVVYYKSLKTVSQLTDTEAYTHEKNC